MSYSYDPSENLVPGRAGTSNTVLKLTYQDLADFFGVERKTISNWFSLGKLVHPRCKNGVSKFLISMILMAMKKGKVGGP